MTARDATSHPERTDAPTAGADPGRSAAPQPWLVRNDYSPLDPPELGAWQPHLEVSVVIPAHGEQRKLDLVLAALAAQSYPAHLMEVVVVDDGSDPPLSLGEVRPDNTKLVSAEPGAWGSAHAVNTGVAASDGAIVMRLDSDMVAEREHVEAQLRWHHQADYLVVLGHKRFTDTAVSDLTPQQVHDALAAGEPGRLFDLDAARPHWVERFIDKHDQLRDAAHRAYHVYVGATGSLPRDLFTRAGGMDSGLILGGDTEFGYRAGQCGAVFVPELESSSWHLGSSQMQSRREEGAAYRDPYLANRVPLFASRRERRHRQWQVPYVDVLVDCASADAAQVRQTLTALLDQDTADLRITLLGRFGELTDERHAPLDDPLVDLRLIAEEFCGEARVRTADSAPAPDLAVTFRLHWPAAVAPARRALTAMTREANDTKAGLVRVAGLGEAPMPRLERTAAFARVDHLLPASASAAERDAAVDRLYGSHVMDGSGTVVAAPATGDETEELSRAELLRQLKAERGRANAATKRADRLQRRIRWATRAHPRRLLRRLLLRR